MKKTSLVFSLLLLLFTATRSVSARFVYVTSSDSQTLTAYATTADTVEGFVIQVNNNVCGFTIGSTGELTQFPNFAVNNIDNPAQIVADPKSSYLYITSATGVHGYAVQCDGTLQEVPGSPFPIQVGPGGLIVQ